MEAKEFSIFDNYISLVVERKNTHPRLIIMFDLQLDTDLDFFEVFCETNMFSFMFQI